MPQIRKMQKEDIPQMAEIAAASFTDPWTEKGFTEALQMGSACFLVAVEGENVMGYCGCYMAADEAEIVNVAVRDDCRKQGIADKLLMELTAYGNEHGVSRFYLEVRVSNEAAIHLYEKHGFIRQGVRKYFYKDIHEDAYVMNHIM